MIHVSVGHIHWSFKLIIVAMVGVLCYTLHVRTLYSEAHTGDSRVTHSVAGLTFYRETRQSSLSREMIQAGVALPPREWEIISRTSFQWIACGHGSNYVPLSYLNTYIPIYAQHADPADKKLLFEKFISAVTAKKDISVEMDEIAKRIYLVVDSHRVAELKMDT